ncbi:MAG: glutathione S-transferase family protein [Phenylobacterium sp.]|uniref:glutathione S-transferase family protein n=1 Tax=Phenylobacterium sp. TaxID=1871053 RepID=UPI001A32023A|nr:glutathione S-transferase family protein [Phenylobacterium sp.]MBJ7411848.1 glutathione S-transferase family protein [Phenylobacterium sp.]
MPDLELVSHHLCPYVQRAAITLAEKGVPFRRMLIDLSDKPRWFLDISPLGKVPLLRVGGRVLFESAAICDYLDEVYAPQLHPHDPLERAEHRAWTAVASTVLDDIGGLYNAPDAEAFDRRAAILAERFTRLEQALGRGPFFPGEPFCLVDAAFAPVFRYFDVLDSFVSLGLFAAKPRVAAWRRALASRPSVKTAVDPDYPERLERFFRTRNSHLARLINDAAAPAA